MLNLATRFQSTKQSPHTGKFACVFENVRILPNGETYVAAEITSGYVFPTAAAARCGALRAIEAVETTERFPNMCEAF